MSNNLEMFRGDTQEWDITAALNGTAMDLTGAKLWFTAKKGVKGAQVLQRTSDPGGGIVIDPDQVANKGKATVTLQNTDTAGLPSETTVLFYDVQVKVGAKLWTILSGNLTVKPDATTEVA